MINVYYIIYSVFVVGCVKTTKLIVACLEFSRTSSVVSSLNPG